MATGALNPCGVATVIRARNSGARFKPHATVFRREGRLVARIDFHEPVGPERELGVVVLLNTVLWENQ
jgi:hypothetical protein